MRTMIGHLAAGLVLFLTTPAVAAADIAFTVTMSEPVIVSTASGTPSIGIIVGSDQKAAGYASGSGTNQLTFSYRVQQGDFDPDGIAITQQNGQASIALNNGAITDLAGNPLTSLTFTPPATTGLKVQTYAVAFNGTIDNTNAATASFTISKAAVGATYTATISSSGGTGTMVRTGTISTPTQTVSNVDVSALAAGTLTVSVELSDGANNKGAAATASIEPSFTGVLDTLGTSATAAYSLRRLGNAYTGPLVLVRRSDGAEQGFSGNTVGGGLDAAALLDFCNQASPATCTVKTWYDQSSNARDATQAAVASQPRIVNAGTLDTIGNGRPAVRTLGSQRLKTAAFTGGISQFTANAVLRTDNPGLNWGRFVSVASTQNGQDYDASTSVAAILVGYYPNVLTSFRISGGTNAPISVGTAAVATTWYNATTGNIAVNGTVATPWSFAAASLGASVELWLGADKQGAYATGAMGEALWFHSALSTSERQSLEANQKAWYGTP